MRYWCISTSSENWKVRKAYGLWGMDARYFPTLEKFLRAGDKAVVYTHGGFFVAIIEFLGDYFYSEEDIDGQKVLTNFCFLTESNSKSSKRADNHHGFHFRQKKQTEKLNGTNRI